MKIISQIRIILLLTLLIGCGLPAFAQQVDTIYVRNSASVILSIDWKPGNYGTIQWQRSSNQGATWSNLSGATKPTYECPASELYLYRAKIQSQKECAPVYITKAMKIVRFTINISKQKSNAIEFSLAGVDFRGAKVVEYGFCYNNTKLDTRSLLDMNKLKVGETLPDTSAFKMVCNGLQPGTSYNIRNYFKLSDGTIIYSDSKAATTSYGLKWTSENWTISKNSMALRFELAGYSATTEPVMSLMFGPAADSLTAQTINKLGSFKYSSSTITGLKANKMYLAQVSVKFGDSTHVFTKQVKTLSDYSSFIVDNTTSGIKHKIVWDTTRHQISPVGLKTEYPRVIRLNADTLLCAYHGGANDYWVNIYLQKSYDNGATWSAPTIILDKENSTFGKNYWRFTNPEMIRLQNGWILMSVTGNGNPETNDNCHVMVLISKDGGDTWGDPIIVGRGRTWEPMVVQLPNGELELFVSSEAQWWGTTTPVQQEILFSRSTDNGETWTTFKRASYSPDRRDGMPAAIVMKGNKGVLFSIEIVNDNGWGSPTFVKRTLTEEWNAIPWDNINTTKRWDIPMNTFGGAPYTVQLPTGEIVVSAHANGRSVWQTSYPRIVIADNNGRNFTSPTIPITNLPALQGLYYNSLFVKDDTTIWLVMTNSLFAADGTTRIKGEIKYIEGKIVKIN